MVNSNFQPIPLPLSPRTQKATACCYTMLAYPFMLPNPNVETEIYMFLLHVFKCHLPTKTPSSVWSTKRLKAKSTSSNKSWVLILWEVSTKGGKFLGRCNKGNWDKIVKQAKQFTVSQSQGFIFPNWGHLEQQMVYTFQTLPRPTGFSPGPFQ